MSSDRENAQIMADMHDAHITRIKAAKARQWAAANNCAIVPLEPTDVMLAKASPYLDDEKACIRIAYKAMVTAAQAQDDAQL